MNRKRRRIVLVGAAVIVLVVFYRVFDPMEWGFMPQCVFHRLTGLQCAGCGSQRMLHALLCGDIVGAWRANALLLVMLPVIGFLVWVETQRKWRPALYRRVYSPALVIVVGILLVVWTIGRNLSIFT